MASLDIDCNGLVKRSETKKPPKHHTLTIDSFSSLKSEDRYESGEFDVEGYKWKLVLFPTGNKKRNVTDHISLYLELGGQKPIEPEWTVTVDYKFFLLNQQKEKKTYLVLEYVNKKEKKYCFYRTIVGGLAGFDRFISLEDFSDAFNGYLNDDTCQLEQSFLQALRYLQRLLYALWIKSMAIIILSRVNTGLIPRSGIGGFAKLITQEANARFLKNDTCIVEAEITIRGISMPGISSP
ncbi:hypothetical protein M0R45_025038 [Rubus argutus]|uniref:MATH domain-containing protein n=1 Tax=Rubus argutus TaxID=59490 RepID=A0AAW1WWU4_RUBAR